MSTQGLTDRLLLIELPYLVHISFYAVMEESNVLYQGRCIILGPKSWYG